MTPLDELADLVTLVYHEARNVRHLVRAKAIGPAEWKYLIALPRNRYDAWTVLQEVRRAARSEPGVSGVLRQFEQRFRIDLGQLEALYGHAGWRGSNCGGNAWLGITTLVRKLADSLDRGLEVDTATFRESLQVARHNTGTVAEKLRRLDEALSSPPAG